MHIPTDAYDVYIYIYLFIYRRTYNEALWLTCSAYVLPAYCSPSGREDWGPLHETFAH